MKKAVAIILAGGGGERFKAFIPKQFIKIAGKTMLEHTIEVFEKSEFINDIYVVVNPMYYSLADEILSRNSYQKVSKLLKGGNSRQESSKIGVFACDDTIGKVLIHEAVRPFVSQEIISEVVRKLDEYVAVDVAIPTADTIIKVSEKDKIIVDIPKRSILMRGQTPQGFNIDIIRRAHKLAEEEGVANAVDDCSLVLKYNLGKIFVVKGSEMNIKVTYPEDIYIADRIFQLKNTHINVYNVKNKVAELRNKVIIVFGGTDGIGKEIVDIAENNNAHVYPFSRRLGVDIAKRDQVHNALEKVVMKEGRIDVVINAAGLLVRGNIETSSFSEIERQIEVNLIGSINVSKLSIPYLKDTHGMLILFTSSSYTRGRAGYAPYSLSKAAIVNLVQALSEEVFHYGVKVNAICPERTNTHMRRVNFGKEPENSLLNPRSVAYFTLLTALSGFTGQVVDVRKSDEKFLKETS